MKDLVKNTVLLGAGYLIGKKVAQSRKSPAIGSTGKGIDQTALNEVILFAENDQKLYGDLMKNYYPNLKKKIKSGKYNPELAIKLLEYYYTLYVRPYMKDRKNYGWDSKLNPAERREFAKYFRDVLLELYQEGE
jgi:hypothetical protein